MFFQYFFHILYIIFCPKFLIDNLGQMATNKKHEKENYSHVNVSQHQTMVKPKMDSSQVDSLTCQFLHVTEMWCPFCGFRNYPINPPKEISNNPNNCCSKQNLKDANGQVTCIHCGQVIAEDFKTEYINYHDNLYKIYIKKTVYNREYHLANTLDKLILSSKIKINVQNSIKINKIFAEIDNILPEINGKRKQFISLKYLLNRILQLMKKIHHKLH